MSVVIGFSSKDMLMLDCDSINPEKLIQWCEGIAKEINCSVLIMMTSTNRQLTLDQRKLDDSFSAIFGKKMQTEDIKGYVSKALEDEIINLKFAKMREHTSLITLRINAKTPEKTHPTPYFYYRNGDRTGITEFLNFWSLFKNLIADSISKRRRTKHCMEIPRSV